MRGSEERLGRGHACFQGVLDFNLDQSRPSPAATPCHGRAWRGCLPSELLPEGSGQTTAHFRRGRPLPTSAEAQGLVLLFVSEAPSSHQWLPFGRGCGLAVLAPPSRPWVEEAALLC